MKSERIYQAVGNADDVLLERCEKTEINRKPPRWMKWSGLAACLCLLLAGSLVMNGTFPGGNPESRTGEFYKASGTVVDSFPSAGPASSMYAAPDNGQWIYFTQVEDALQEHGGQEVEYFLALDIFQDQTKLEDQSDEVKAELERLTKLGYHVGYSEYWTYRGEGTRVTASYVSGYFTAKQLKSFAANKNYGYSFRFASNGDGSPVPAEQGITADFDSAIK